MCVIPRMGQPTTCDTFAVLRLPCVVVKNVTILSSRKSRLGCVKPIVSPIFILC